MRIDLRLKKNPHRFLKYKKYVNGVWYNTDSKGNATTPSNSRSQTYDPNTGTIKINTGNGGSVTTNYTGNPSDKSNNISGTKVSGGQTVSNANSNSSSQTTKSVENTTPVAETPKSTTPTTPVTPTTPTTPTTPAETPTTPITNTNTTTTSQNKILNGSAEALRAFERSGKTLNDFVNDPNNSAYVKVDTTGVSSGNGYVNDDGSAKLVTEPESSALANAFKAIAGQQTFTESLAKGENNKNVIPITDEDLKNKYTTNNENALTKAYQELEGDAINQKEKQSLIDAYKRLFEGQTPSTINPGVTDAQDTDGTQPTTSAPEPSIIDKIYEELKNGLIGGYVWDETLIADKDAYDFYKNYLTEKYGADVAAQFLNDWAKKYYDATGESAGNARIVSSLGYNPLTTTSSVKTSSSGIKSATTVTDAANELEKKLASITSSYENSSGKTSAENSNKQVDTARKDAMTSKRLAKKSYLEVANATGLASGNIDQEEFAREQAYKQKLAALKDIEDENNELLKKYEEAYQQELSDANDEYDTQVEKIRAAMEEQRTAVSNANVNTNSNGQNIYSFSDGSGNIKSYSREQLIAAGKQNFVDSMDAEQEALEKDAEQQALKAAGYDYFNVQIGNQLDDTYGTIRLEGTGETVYQENLDKLMYEGKVRAIFDGKTITYYGIK